MVADAGLTEELLSAALLVRQHAGRINDLIHATVILRALPLILEPGERVLKRPSLAAGNDPGRKFDLETTHRIAEFKVAFWKGADTMRQRSLVADLVGLALDTSGKRAELYVVGDKPIRYLRTCSTSVQHALARSSPTLRAAFTAQYGEVAISIRDFAAQISGRVVVKDLRKVLPPLASMSEGGWDVG
ncbi:hypothetical protein GCM10023192_34430 [Amycolatopsis samaneae]